MTQTTIEMITITKEEHERLKSQDEWVNALEVAGVDNWDGYGYAQEIMEDEG